LDYFVGSTAPMLERDDPILRTYLAHDLSGGKVRLSGDALRRDAADLYFGPNPWAQLQVPARFLHAEFSVGPGSRPNYPPDVVDEVRRRFDQVRYVPGVDHAGSIMTMTGARATAELLDASLAGDK
jgi:hypothetical protein